MEQMLGMVRGQEAGQAKLFVDCGPSISMVLLKGREGKCLADVD